MDEYGYSRPPRRGGWGALTVAIVAFVLGALLGSVALSSNGGYFSRSVSRVSEIFDEEMVKGIYDGAIRAVAKVETVQTAGRGTFFGQRGQGSGFLVTRNGEFLTNYHVIEGADQVKVILDGGQRLDGAVVGTDPGNDLALLRVDAAQVAGVTPLILADSSEVRPGQIAIALGSPFGLQGSVTVGIVSGVDRTLRPSSRRAISGMIQTDADIFPGNSGGPLLNSSGQVIGINTALATRGDESVGFAVPSNVARRELERLSQGESLKRGWLGVSVLTVDSQNAADLGLEVESGAYVIDVFEGSPAEAAGVRPAQVGPNDTPGPGGDLIVAIDGRGVTGANGLIAAFAEKQPGDSALLDIVREGRRGTLTVTLADWPDGVS